MLDSLMINGFSVQFHFYVKDQHYWKESLSRRSIMQKVYMNWDYVKMENGKVLSLMITYLVIQMEVLSFLMEMEKTSGFYY
jgi:hypothetical protein